jgi:hypothetical protein
MMKRKNPPLSEADMSELAMDVFKANPRFRKHIEAEGLRINKLGIPPKNENIGYLADKYLELYGKEAKSK